MTDYKISGVWKNTQGIITHYAVHKANIGGHSRATKMTKAEALELVENPHNTVYTWVWNYTQASWRLGEKVHVVGGKFLRSNPDTQLTDNLDHLIDYDWIAP